MTNAFVHAIQVGTSLVVTIDRPERKNALGRDVGDQLTAHLADANNNAAIRSVVITGAGGIFSAGADIKEFPTDAGEMMRHVEESVGLLTSPERVRKPVIAAVDGPAFGGGFELAMTCDAIVASSRAVFGLPEPRLGLTPGIAIQRLPQLIGIAGARKVLLFGQQLDAQAAKELGLVHDVVADPEQLVQAAVGLAEGVAGLAPLALEVAKSSINRLFVGDLLLSIRSNGFLAGTADVEEGKLAFAERRPPVFRGR